MSHHRNELIKVPIHRSLIRRMMFLGGERTNVITSMIFCGYMAYLLTFRHGVVTGIVVAGTLWAVLIFLARLMARADEQMWQVVKRHLKYRAFYPARGRFDAPVPLIRDFK
jgi:type IV secretion system protein VirB3